VEKQLLLKVVVHLVRMQLALMLQLVLQDELMLQHLPDEFFRRFPFQ
jgi:hypothetical protein